MKKRMIMRMMMRRTIWESSFPLDGSLHMSRLELFGCPWRDPLYSLFLDTARNCKFRGICENIHKRKFSTDSADWCLSILGNSSALMSGFQKAIISDWGPGHLFLIFIARLSNVSKLGENAMAKESTRLWCPPKWMWSCDAASKNTFWVKSR